VKKEMRKVKRSLHAITTWSFNYLIASYTQHVTWDAILSNEVMHMTINSCVIMLVDASNYSFTASFFFAAIMFPR
jgi:hypothetical protein